MADVQIDFQDDKRADIRIHHDSTSFYLAFDGETDNLTLYLEHDQMQQLSDVLCRYGITPSPEAQAELEMTSD